MDHPTNFLLAGSSAVIVVLSQVRNAQIRSDPEQRAQRIHALFSFSGRSRAGVFFHRKQVPPVWFQLNRLLRPQYLAIKYRVNCLRHCDTPSVSVAQLLT